MALAGNIIGNGIGFAIYQIVDVQGDVFFENVKTNMMFITGEVQEKGQTVKTIDAIIILG